jgi:predicted Zn-dependent protease
MEQKQYISQGVRLFLLLTCVGVVVCTGCFSRIKTEDKNANAPVGGNVQNTMPAVQKTEAPNPATAVADERPVDVWLVPMEGFPQHYAIELGQKLSAELGIKIRPTVSAARTKTMFGANGQIMADRVFREMEVALRRLYDTSPKTIYIILTDDDLNFEKSPWRFCFVAGWDGVPVVIVSLARMKNSFAGYPDDPNLTKLRLYKMVKKQIGLLYFKKSRSARLNSVLYSPVMGLEDLDAIGTDF